MQKHAYMIIAHNEFDLLEILVRLWMIREMIFMFI